MMRRLLIIPLLSFFFYSHSGYSQVDLQILSAPGLVSGCNLSCSTPVSVLIYNVASSFIFGETITVQYSVNSSTPITETTTLPGMFGYGTILFTFTPANNLSLCNDSTYVIDFLVTTTSADLNPLNNYYSITVVNDTTVIGGTLNGSTTVCESGNAGVLNLYGNTGYIDYWLSSTDGVNWDTITTTNDTLSYTNILVPTYYQVYIDGGFCPDDVSPIAYIDVDDSTVAGFLVGDATVCSIGNSGTINLTGQNGAILDWQYNDGGGWYPIGNTSSSYTYTNLTTTTTFQAIVQNGVCPSSVSDSVIITVEYPAVAGTVLSDTSICEGSATGSLTLSAYSGSINYWISSSDGGSTWSPIANTSNTQGYSSLSDTTTYCAVLQNGVCPADTSTCATITILPLPVANAGLNDTINLGETVCLNGSGGVSYMWVPSADFDSAFVSSPCTTPTFTGTFTYILTVANNYGCTDNDAVTITVMDTTATIIPPKIPNLIVCNFITPNNDGDNDVWNIIDIEYFANNEVTILNNHGQILYSKKGYLNTWNGDNLPDGSYYYVVKIDDLDKIFKGVLTISSSK